MENATRRLFITMAMLGASGAAIPATARTQGSELSLDDVIARHTEARGGVKAIDAICSQTVKLEIMENGSVISGRYLCSKAPAFRIDIFDHGKHVFCEGLDANGPWIWPSPDATAKQGVPDAKRTGIEGIEFNLYGLHALPSLGNTLALDGREKLGGVNYYVVSVALKDSYQAYLYIDPESWMIARRRDFRAAHPDVNDTKKYLEKQYSDYRPVNGVQTAFLEHQVDLASGKITQVSVVDSMTYGVEPDANVPDRTFTAW
jgi:hypothetical protein